MSFIGTFTHSLCPPRYAPTRRIVVFVRLRIAAMMFNPQVLFSNTSVDAMDYQWYFEDANILESNLENPSVNFPEGIVSDYNVTLIAISEYGCADTIHQLVKVNPEVIFYAPNTFTPDGDEFNQTFRVFMEGIDIYKFEMLIFNRWGEIVRRTSAD